MALGELTRQLAAQALGNPVKDVLDALRPADLLRISDSVRAGKPAPPAPGDNTCATMIGQVQAMQKALKEDEELLVLFTSGAETIRVLEVFVPSWSVVVLSGIDTDKNITRVVAHADTIQLVCKVVKAAPPAQPLRVGFITPKPKA